MHGKKSIASFPGSYAYLSGRSDAETAIVFVHGFMGDATGTWLDFQTLADQDIGRAEWWETCDLYFYSYQSFPSNVPVLAARFQQFLRKYFPNPEASDLTEPSVDLRRLLGRDPVSPLELASEYRRLVLVGHSLGGVIIRQAIVDEALSAGTTHLERPNSVGGNLAPATERTLAASVRLFAPATFGFRPTSLGGFLYNLIAEDSKLGKFLRPAMPATPIHEDLKLGSERLQELRKRTEGLAEKYPWIQAMRAHLTFGEKENIVYMERYNCDPVYRIVENQDHQSICKPSPNYLGPVEFVRYGISKAATI
jgi:pimeloyl-ACP methyl ester carboxylesterase